MNNEHLKIVIIINIRKKALKPKYVFESIQKDLLEPVI